MKGTVSIIRGEPRGLEKKTSNITCRCCLYLFVFKQLHS